MGKLYGPIPPFRLAPPAPEKWEASRKDFWNHPERWEGIDDPRKVMIWEKRHRDVIDVSLPVDHNHPDVIKILQQARSERTFYERYLLHGGPAIKDFR